MIFIPLTALEQIEIWGLSMSIIKPMLFHKLYGWHTMREGKRD